MHPGMMYWWKARRQAECQVRRAFEGAEDMIERAGCGTHGSHGEPGARHETRHAGGDRHGEFGGGDFGVRRPLRFLAYKLQLSEPQVSELARILNELKTERAQGEVDGRRTTAALADAVAGDVFDEARAAEGAALRVRSAESLRAAVLKALQQIHALLTPEQRSSFAYLIRTGTLSI